MYISANIKEANAHEKAFRERESRFFITSGPGVDMLIHELSLKMRMSCTVSNDVGCSSSYSLSGRHQSGRDRRYMSLYFTLGYTTFSSKGELRLLRRSNGKVIAD